MMKEEEDVSKVNVTNKWFNIVNNVSENELNGLFLPCSLSLSKIKRKDSN